ncbi:helix-turn-helix domain-containing protein [Bacillus infantis]|uniref:helix-turn-helix domain-containing protein n=1 Tax=Bacillus infantis TaxID=324767 RepID=UPI003CF237A1
MGDNSMLRCHLEEVIIKSGLRKGYVADYIGVSVRQLRKYEKMESIAPIDKAYMLADLLNCKFEDIYEWNTKE